MCETQTDFSCNRRKAMVRKKRMGRILSHALTSAETRRPLVRESNKGGVVQVLLRRGNCALFCHTVPPLQVAPSLACSVASLSRLPYH